MRSSTLWRLCAVALGFAVLCAVFPAMSLAQVPASINYQGKLARVNGDLVNAPAGLAMTFHLYASQNGGTALWTEVHAAVVVTNGQFSVDLGSIVPFGLEFDQPYYLGMTIAPDTSDANPRRPLTSVGYALNSVHAQNSDHATTSDHGHSETADSASHGHSEQSDHAMSADHGHSETADHADHGHSEESDHSVSSDHGHAEFADHSDHGNAETLDNLPSTAFAKLAAANTFAAGTQTVQTGNPATKGLIIRGAAAQSASLQEWQNSSGTPVASVSAGGVFSGDGSGFTGLSASSLSTGTLPSAQLSGTYSSALTLSSNSNVLSGNGANLTSLNATTLTTGTLPSGRLSGVYSSGVTFTSPMNSFTGDGAGLTNLNPNAANYARRVNEQKIAVVVTSLQTGLPGAGTGYYTSVGAALFDLATWCGTPSQLAPCAIRIMPGTYVISSQLQMVSWVDIVGSGEDSTRLQCTVGASPSILGAADSALSFVTLEASSSPTAPAVSLAAGTLRHLSVVATGPRGTNLVTLTGGAIEDASVASLGTGSGGGPGIEISGGSPKLTNVRVSATGAAGIKISQGSSPTLRNVTITMATGVAVVPGIRIEGASTPTLSDVAITMSGTQVIKGISIDNSSPKMTGVVIRVSGAGGSAGVETLNSSSAVMDSSLIELDPSANCSQARGVTVDGSTIDLRGVTVRINNCSPQGVGVEVVAGPGAVARIDHGVVSAGTALLRTAGTFQVGATKLDAVVTASGPAGAFTCVSNYNGNYLPLGSSCQ